ncbi:MAG: FAD:protein FMN transferase, partial [Pirellulaceae bacterium]|nr:FAD:protein FMN transferase [Pirellulaceae bacterium]
MRHILPHLSLRVACLGLFCSLTQLVYPVVADTVSWNGAVFGTTYHIEAHSSIQPLDSDDLRKAVADRLEQIDELMSNWKQDSEVSRFNRLVKPDVWFPVSSETAFVVELAKQVSEQTGGAFDVTVGPIVQLWNFGAGRRDEFRVPNDEEIAQALKQIGMAY